MSIQFVDSTSAPLPAGIVVTVTEGSTTVGTATTNASGVVAITVAQGFAYVASFSGTNAPTGTQSFIGGSNQKRIATESGNELADESGNTLVASTGTSTIVTVATYTITHARVTQVSLEALVTSSPNARVSQVAVTTLANSLANARVSQVAVSALVTVVPEIVSIAVTPATAQVPDGQTQQFTATATYDNGEVIDVTTVATWSATYGTVSSLGLYTAPASRAGNDTISAEVNGVIGTATVTDIVEYTLVLAPRAISIPTNSQIQIAATLNGTDGSSTPVTSGITWSATSGGTISPLGLFTAGPNPSSAVQITALYETYSAIAVVTITATMQLLPTNLAAQGIIGSISLDCPYNGDFTITPQGNLLLAQDTLDDPVASYQRLQRLILTNPTARDAQQNAIGRADDLFNPEYGSGVRATISKPGNGVLVPAIIAGIVARVQNAIAQDAGFAKDPAPIVKVSIVKVPTVGSVLTLFVSVKTVSGVIVTIPSLPLTNGF